MTDTYDMNRVKARELAKILRAIKLKYQKRGVKF